MKMHGLWDSFYSNKIGGDVPSIYLNTESKRYKDPDLKINVINFSEKDKRVNLWGKRLIEALEKIDTKYVLFLLEDYYTDQPIKVGEIEKCLKYLDEDPNILGFHLIPSDGNNYKYYDGEKSIQDL